MDFTAFFLLGTTAFLAIYLHRLMVQAAPEVSRGKWGLGTASFLGLWWGLTVYASLRGGLQATADSAVPWLMLGWLPAIVPILLWRYHGGFRHLVDRIPASRLLGVQSVRWVGILMLWSWWDGQLPAIFAIPAGLGGVATALMAPWAARAVETRHSSGAAWGRLLNLVGLLDIALSMILGGLTGPGPHQALSLRFPSTAASAFPLVLTPAFLVPLVLLVHMASLRSLRRLP
ncbi:MAG: hypothetical protein H6686_07225 [Fibrobacteria bacterium]|nr:hypothetical protein [Fibrobacteria bacterium]